MFCPKCVEEIKEGANFCPYCGNVIKGTIPLWPDEEEIHKGKIETDNKTIPNKSSETIPFDQSDNHKNENDIYEPEMKKSKAFIILPGIIIAVVAIAVIVVIVLLNKGSKTEYEERLDQGHEYMIALEYDKAVNAYEAAIKIDPNTKDAYMELADVYVKMGKSEYAVELLENARDKIDNPDDRAVLNKKKESIIEKADIDIEDDFNNLSIENNPQITSAIKMTPSPKPTPTPEPTPTLEPTSTPSSTPTPSPTNAPVWMDYKDYDAKNRIKSLVASSTLIEEHFDHKVLNVFSDSRDYCWCEGVKGTGIGEYIEIMFDDNIYLSRLNIFNGYSKSEKSYNNNGKAEIIRISYKGGFVDVQLNNLTWKDVKNNEFTDSVNFDEPIYTDFIRIEIRSANKGAKFEDTCISKIGLKALGSKTDRKINTGFFD